MSADDDVGAGRSSGWALVVFASRETPEVLAATLAAAVRSTAHPLVIDVLVNGNAGLADAVAADIAPSLPLHGRSSLRVWSIETADKSNAWNQYLHRLWSGEEIAFFIDGYVRLVPGAVTSLGTAAAASAEVLGGSGVPRGGRKAAALQAEMLRHGGFHGNFCCIKREALSRLRAHGVTIPFGLYRCDALLGALLRFGLDNVAGNWLNSRIVVSPEAQYLTDPKRWWRWRDLAAGFKRTLRQARGELENAAVKNHLVLQKRAANRLPETAAELIRGWAAAFPRELLAALRCSPLAVCHLRGLVAATEPLPAGRSARLCWASAPP